jgi:addiction module HigA family antidote
VGIYGFGAAGHIIAQVAAFQGKRVFAFTRPGDAATQDFARKLGVSRPTLHAVLAERSGVSAEMALRLGTLLGNGAQLWLDMQTQFDLWQAQAKLHDELNQMTRLEPVGIG